MYQQDKGEMSREQYEASVGALRENMREALGRKRKYVIGEEGIEQEGPGVLDGPFDGGFDR